VGEIEVKVSGNKIDAEWEYPVPDNETRERIDDAPFEAYSFPEYYFEAIVENIRTRSGMLACGDSVEICLKDHDGKAIGNKKYKALLSSGEVRQGTFDGSGKAKLEKVPPGKILFSLDPRS
jgi:hypothetical protein